MFRGKGLDNLRPLWVELFATAVVVLLALPKSDGGKHPAAHIVPKVRVCCFCFVIWCTITASDEGFHQKADEGGGG